MLLSQLFRSFFPCILFLSLVTCQQNSSSTKQQKEIQNSENSQETSLITQVEELSKEEKKYFKKLLKKVDRLMTSRREWQNVTEEKLLLPPKCFISYAWDPNPEKNEKLQAWLRKLQHDLMHAGIDVRLDVTNMNGNIKEYMQQGIQECDFILLIGTPYFKQRIEQYPESCVAFEVSLAKQKAEMKSKCLLPILFEGNYDESFPKDFKNYLIRDFRNQQNYRDSMIQLENPLGLIPSIYEITFVDKDYKQLLKTYRIQIENSLLKSNSPLISGSNQAELDRVSKK
jgi:TIR domain